MVDGVAGQGVVVRRGNRSGGAGGGVEGPA